MGAHYDAGVLQDGIRSAQQPNDVLGLSGAKGRRLEIIRADGRLKTSPAELRGNVLGSKVEPARRRGPAFKQIGGDE